MKKIRDSKKFTFGLFLIIFSYLPFSYMNHLDKLKIENCHRISGEIKTVEKTYRKGGEVQDGWMIKLYGVKYKVRIVGEYYKAIHHEKFKQFIKKGARIEVYILKLKFYGIFEKMNSNRRIKDALSIICSEEKVLEIQSIQDRLSNLFIINLIFGIITIGLGSYMITNSIVTSSNKV